MKKLLIITKTLLTNDGQGRYSLDLIKRLKNNYRLVVFSFDKAENREDGVSYHKLNNVFFSWSFLKNLKTADLVHCFSDYPYCLLPFWPYFLFKKPIFITAHGTYGVEPLDKVKSSFLLKRAYKKAKKIICISKFTEKQILKRIQLKNTVVINNGVDYDKFQKENIRQIKGDEKIVLSVGALKPRKGYHVSISAITEVKKKYPKIKYYIVGGKPPDIYLEMVKKYGIENNVVFFENISDEKLTDLYYQSDVFLLPSITENDNDFEGFGLVYLEAGACGKPVIGAFGSGAEDAIIDGETGILVPQNDIQKTAEVILKLLDNPELAGKMGETGKKRAQLMSWDTQIKKYIENYENTINQSAKNIF
ncbi:MAG: glycosyltransferase family 4 protein [Nanoarchaeota archaeon]|nr:glycosyltransferase family 4 protein [Nanoarchaeota archaeon]